MSDKEGKHPVQRRGSGGGLPPEVRDWVLERLARWTSQVDVRKELRERFGIEYGQSSMSRLSKREAENIQKRRDNYLRDYTDIPLAFPKERITRMVGWLEHAQAGIPVYVKTGHGVEAQIKPDYYLCLQILRAIRDEMELIRPENADEATIEAEWRVRLRKQYDQVQREVDTLDKKREVAVQEMGQPGGGEGGSTDRTDEPTPTPPPAPRR